MKLVIGSLHPVAGATRVGATETLGRRNIEQKGEIGNEAASRQTVRGACLGFGKSAAEDLVRVRRQEKTVEQNHSAIIQRWHDLAPVSSARDAMNKSASVASALSDAPCGELFA
jgi:hypothetical protein